MEHIIAAHIKPDHSAGIIRQQPPDRGKQKPEKRILAVQLMDPPCHISGSGKPGQKPEGRLQQIGKAAAGSKHRNTQKSHRQICAYAEQRALRSQENPRQQHEKELKGKVHGHWLDRDRDLKKRPGRDQRRKQSSIGQVLYGPSVFFHILVCLAPVHHFCSRLSTVYTGIGQLFLLKGHTAGGHARLFL